MNLKIKCKNEYTHTHTHNQHTKFKSPQWQWINRMKNWDTLSLVSRRCCRVVFMWIYFHRLYSVWSQFVAYKSRKTFKAFPKWPRREKLIKMFLGPLKWGIRQLILCIWNVPPMSTMNDFRVRANEISMATYSSFRRIQYNFESRTVLILWSALLTFTQRSAFHRKLKHAHTSRFHSSVSFAFHKNTLHEMKRDRERTSGNAFCLDCCCCHFVQFFVCAEYYFHI